MPLPNLPGLKEVEQVLTDITGKLDKLSNSEEILRVNPHPWDDIATAVDRVSRLSERWGKQLGEVVKQTKDLQKTIDKEEKLREKIFKHLEKERKLQEALGKERQKAGKWDKEKQERLEKSILKTEELQDKLEEITEIQQEHIRQQREMASSWGTIGKLIGGSVLISLDKMGKALLSLSIAAVKKSFDMLYDGIMKVYELFERWTKAMGQFNLQLGSLTTNIGGATRVGKQWESQIRGLTDNFGEGLQMYQEFVKGFERILPEKEAEAWGKLGLGMARGLGMGSAAAGQFSKTMYQMGANTKQVWSVLGDIEGSANAAGISVNEFAREIAGSHGFMAQFGRDGQKMITRAMGFAKSLGISVKSLESFTKATDTFGNTATMVAKLNSVFGTTINSLDVMMEQDPAKRFEMIRRELLNQGKTWDNMSRLERRFVAETVGINEEEIAGAMKAGKTLGQFQEEQAKKRVDEKKAQEDIQKAMHKTATTLFAFGAAWDSVTMSIVQLIKPFTDVLGLTNSGDKQMKSFGQVMGNAFKLLNTFIRDLAKDKGFNDFMKRLAHDFKDLAGTVAKFVTSGDLKKWVLDAKNGIENLYKMGKQIMDTLFTEQNIKRAETIFAALTDNVTGLLKAFALLKGLMIGGTIISGLSGVSKLAGGGGSLPGLFSVLGKGLTSLSASIGSFITSTVGATTALGAIKTLGLVGFLTAWGAAIYKGTEKILEWTGAYDLMGRGIDAYVQNMQMSWEKVTGFVKGLFSSEEENKARKRFEGGTASNTDLALFQGSLSRAKFGTGLSEKDLSRLQELRNNTALRKTLSEMSGGNWSEDDIMQVLARSYGKKAGEVTAPAVAAPVHPINTSVEVREPTLGDDGSVRVAPPKNYANKKNAKDDARDVKFIAGDVYLDSEKVGTHLLRKGVIAGE